MSSNHPSPIQVKQIDHITLVVKDLEISRQFYCDLLGMEEMARPAFTFPGKWFQAGNTFIHLILENDESGESGVHNPERNNNTRAHHLAFLSDNVKEAFQFLEEQGVPILKKPKDRPDGALQGFVNDPDGHVVELSEPVKS